MLRHGGAGHTASIHTQSESAAREYGQKVPASRVCVNTSAVHGSVGYSTNLFPAMTLGCGSAGGNITSDNIGPHHLMNLKRIAWESRPVEHKTIPADQRLAGSSAIVATAPAAPSRINERSRPTRPIAHPKNAQRETPAPAAATIIPDRQTIAKIVERVFTARGIPEAQAQVRSSNPAKRKSTNSSRSSRSSGSRTFAPSSKGANNIRKSASSAKANATILRVHQSKPEEPPSPIPKPPTPRNQNRRIRKRKRHPRSHDQTTKNLHRPKNNRNPSRPRPRRLPRSPNNDRRVTTRLLPSTAGVPAGSYDRKFREGPELESRATAT